jgi:peptidoglycan/LPS O-acetylase OafA/YrhL
VFYVLSGFLLWSVFDDWVDGRAPRLPVVRYAKRRALRILPPYYAQIALLAALGTFTAWVEPPRFDVLLLDVTLTHGWSYEHFQAVNNVWWTLSTEAQFYVALPLLAILVRRFGWARVLMGGLATMLAWRIAAFLAFRDAPIIERVWIIEQLPGRIDQFLFGMLACDLARSRGAWAQRWRETLAKHPARRRCLVALGPVVLVALAYRLHVGDFFLRYWEGHAWLFAWHTVAGLAVATSLYAIAVRVPTAAPTRWQPLVAFGTISYSFYLSHELLLRWLGLWLKATVGESTGAAFAINFALGLPLALAVSIAWYAAFERPFLRARARLR